jgi:hypothetical protein
VCLSEVMFRISVKDTRSRRVLYLEGKLIDPWTDELTRAVSQARRDHPDDLELVVDLKGVTDISARGEEALYGVMVQGAKLRGGGVFMKQVLKQLSRRMRRN